MDQKQYIYRCFAVYSVKRNDLIFVARRGCGKSFNDSIKDVVKLCKEAQINTQIQYISHKGDNFEWYGLIEREPQIYFLIMTVSGMDQQQALKDAQELSIVIKKIHKYDLLQRTEIQEKRSQDIIYKMNGMDQKLAGNFDGQYSDEGIIEVSIGNTINISDNLFSNQQVIVNFIQPQSQILKNEVNKQDYNPPISQFNSNNNSNNFFFSNNSLFAKQQFASEVKPDSRQKFYQTVLSTPNVGKRAPDNNQQFKPVVVLQEEQKDMRIHYICYSILIITILFGISLGQVFEII